MTIASFLQKGIALLFVKFFSLIVAMLSTIYVARHLGPSQFGNYSFVISIVSILAITSQLGGPQVIIRAISANIHDSQRLTELIGSSFILQLIISCGLSLFAGFVLFYSKGLSIYLCVMIALSIPLMGNIPLLAGISRGEKRVVLSQLPEFVVKNLIFIILLFITGEYWQIDLINVVFCFFISVLISWYVGLLVVIKKTSSVSVKPKIPRLVNRKNIIYIFSLSYPFATMTIAQVMMSQLDIAMLGAIGDSSQAGIYKAMSTIGVLVLLGHQIGGMIIAPYMSEKFNSDDYIGLKRIYFYSVCISVIFALAVLFFILFLGDNLLFWTYGESFVSGYSLLLIIATGYLLGVILGPVGVLLNMVNEEKASLKITLIACAVNVVGNFIAIPIYGMYGAAITTFISVVVWNYGMFLYAKRIEVI